MSNDRDFIAEIEKLHNELKDKTVKLSVANDVIEAQKARAEKCERDYRAIEGDLAAKLERLREWIEKNDREIKQLRDRAEHAEKQFEISEASRNSMRHRMERAEATIAAIKGAMQ